MNVENTIDLCRLKEMLSYQKEKKKEIDFQIEILERLINETSKKERKRRNAKMAEQGVKHMKTIANEYKEYITERIRLGDNGIKLTAYSFENGYQARVIENLDSNIVSLVLVKFEDGKNSIKDILLELTPEQLIEKLEEIKNL